MSRPSRSEMWASATLEERQRLLAAGFEPPEPQEHATATPPEWLRLASRRFDAVWAAQEPQARGRT